MQSPPKLFIIFLAVDWDLFNRREMIKALATVLKEHGSTVIAVNRPLCPVTTIINKRHRLKELFAGPRIEKLYDNLFIYSPKYIIHDHIAGRIRFLEKLNILALRRSFKKLFRKLKLENERPVVWYYYPQQGYVSGIFRQSFVIYELKDALADSEGSEIQRLTALEKKGKGRVNLFLSVINFLFKKYSPGYKSAYLFGNGISRATFEALKKLPARNRLENERPQIGYSGMVSDRIDWKLIKQIAVLKPEWDLNFHGLIADGGLPDRFKDINNIKFYGSFTQNELPSILAGYDIAILPYLENDFFLHTHPLKFFEYVAAGLPVVTSLNYELKDFPEILIQMPEYNAKSWIAAIERQLSANRLELKQAGLQVAEQHVWDTLCEKLIEKITELYA